MNIHYTFYASSKDVGTKDGASSYFSPLVGAFVLIKSFKLENCLGPNCCIISGSKSFIVFVSGAPTITNALLCTFAKTILI
jgi:hypothetical protein